MEETWKDIPDYEGYYQASNLGRIRSLERVVKSSKNRSRTVVERILVLSYDTYGYKIINLNKEGKSCTNKVHRLVMLTFMGESNLEVDHINGIRDDNRLCNLRYCTQRENVHFYRDKIISSSNFIGVSWCDATFKWKVSIKIGNKSIHLGYYISEIEASEIYNSALLNWNTSKTIPEYINQNKTSKYKGVSWNKSKNKWVVQLSTKLGGKRYLGAFEAEEEAINFLNTYLNGLK